jgi:hypothetical protein
MSHAVDLSGPTEEFPCDSLSRECQGYNFLRQLETYRRMDENSVQRPTVIDVSVVEALGNNG